MSFSSDVKEELARQCSKAKHCQIAELAAMMSFAGQFGKIGADQYKIGFQTENEDVVRKGFTLLTKTYNIKEDVPISCTQGSHSSNPCST